MHWIAPGIETNIAYGTCTLLFALLVMSVRNRKSGARTPYSYYPALIRATARPARKKGSAQGTRRAATPTPKSELFLSDGLKSTPREQAKTKAPVNIAKSFATLLEFQAPQNSNEVNMNTSSYPFEILDPVALAEISAFAAPSPAAPSQEAFPLSPAVQSLLQTEERSAQETLGASDPRPASETPSNMSIAAEQSAVEEPTMDSQPPTLDATAETTAETVAVPNLLSFFGLQQQPFDVTPDPAYLYMSSSHRDALASLKQGIEHFRGFMMLIAEPGMGKTTLLNKLMEELTESARVVFLFQTQCTSRELLCFILNELEVDHAGMDVVAMHRALNQALLEEMLRGRRFVLVVDEAQNLQEPVLETIRLLSDFETTHSKLIQIVLAGQPQLAETLTRDALVQLRQRIAVLSNLQSLTPAETAEYVEYRLRAAGWSGNLLFTTDAIERIAESSAGVPRSINNLCFNAMLESFHRGLEIVDADIVTEVAGKLNLESLVRRPQVDAVSQESAAQAEAASTSQLARALAAALSAEARPDLIYQSSLETKPKHGVELTGTITEKVRSQGWSKQHEYRILVTLERDPVSGLPVADRYYCCSLYMDEAQAAGLKAGKPVRIKIEQD